MLAKRAPVSTHALCRRCLTTRVTQPVLTLSDASVNTFRAEAFQPSTPALFPPNAFRTIPAIKKWFITSDKQGKVLLNRTYLRRFGSTVVPLEISNDEHFSRTQQTLSFFLECVYASSSTFDVRPSRYFSAYIPGARAVKKAVSNNFFNSASALTAPTARVYLAQAPIADLPWNLRDDVPTPELVLQAGKGDVYDSSIWLGEAPTYTPLHRDPNPNLFVQIAGKKVVRMLAPNDGGAIFAKVQEEIGGNAAETLRGEEMMQGAEKTALECVIWNDEAETTTRTTFWQAELQSGDGLFIPKGWWHSVKGTGDGMVGSLNWWFR